MAATNEEAVDFELDEDDLMDEDLNVSVDHVDSRSAPRIRSTITGGGGSGAKKTKGRGFRGEADAERNRRFSARDFESLDSDGGGPGPLRCRSHVLSFFSYFLGYAFHISISYLLFFFYIYNIGKNIQFCYFSAFKDLNETKPLGIVWLAT